MLSKYGIFETVSSDDENWSEKRDPAAEGLDKRRRDVTDVVQSIISGNGDGSIRETVGFIKRLFTDEKLEDPAAMDNPSKDGMVIAVF